MPLLGGYLDRFSRAGECPVLSRGSLHRLCRTWICFSGRVVTGPSDFFSSRCSAVVPVSVQSRAPGRSGSSRQRLRSWAFCTAAPGVEGNTPPGLGRSSCSGVGSPTQDKTQRQKSRPVCCLRGHLGPACFMFRRYSSSATAADLPAQPDLSGYRPRSTAGMLCLSALSAGAVTRSSQTESSREGNRSLACCRSSL